ncbi:MAG: hypothetical protein P1V81_06910, partial [Planctomycetota bacterium]|nr:hypothetical protein [Planctomycetota bacterium]
AELRRDQRKQDGEVQAKLATLTSREEVLLLRDELIRMVQAESATNLGSVTTLIEARSELDRDAFEGQLATGLTNLGASVHGQVAETLHSELASTKAPLAAQQAKQAELLESLLVQVGALTARTESVELTLQALNSMHGEAAASVQEQFASLPSAVDVERLSKLVVASREDLLALSMAVAELADLHQSPIEVSTEAD